MLVVAIIVATITIFMAAVVVVLAPLLTMVITMVMLPLKASSPISFFGVDVGVCYL